jgi:hypothetical protein
MVDTYSGLRVYGLYGISASFVFLSLSLIALASTYRQTRTSMIALTVFFGAMAGAANLNRALSGVTIVGAIVVLWIFHTSSWRKLYIPVAAGICALLVAFSFQLGVMGFVNQHRAAVIGTSMSNLPEGHGTWHPLYLGLSYIGANKDTPSPFGVMWDDKFAWEKAKTVDPNVIPASSEYDQIIKSLYLQEVKNHPVWALTMYTQKAVDTLHQVIWPLLFIALVTILLFRRAKKSGKQLVRIIALALPAILYGLVPPILVYPMRYYESELTAALSLLICVSLGGLVLMLTTKRPVGVKSETVESLADLAAEPDCDISVVVPSRNGSCSLPKTLETLRTSLSSCDEIVVVENGSTDETWQVLRELQSSWPEGGVRLILAQSPPGLGNALREGVLTSHGARCLLTADDLPFGMSDLDEFRKCNSPPNVVIGSKGHPNSRVERSSRRTSMSSVFRQLRRTFLNSTVSDSQGTFWVDGSWAREFAATSREPGLLWTTELVLASESQGLEVGEVPVTLVAEHEQVASRFGLSDAVSSVYRTLKLSGYKDYYQSFHVPVKVYSEIG